MTNLREPSNLLVGGRLDIIHGHSTVRQSDTSILDLWNSDIRSVWVFEVHHGGPVIRLVFFEAAGGARCQLRKVKRRIHGEIESEIAGEMPRREIPSMRSTGYFSDVRILS